MTPAKKNASSENTDDTSSEPVATANLTLEERVDNLSETVTRLQDGLRLVSALLERNIKRGVILDD